MDADGVGGAQVAETIVAMERLALERWGQGDPDGFLDISAQEVSYFDPFIEKRIDGLDGLRAFYEQLRGKVDFKSFEIIDPRVQVAGGIAVLTFHFESAGSEAAMRWNTTEVYQQTGEGWRIIHTHWSLHQQLPAS